jgi:tryptophanyl-tRNA synthetase
VLAERYSSYGALKDATAEALIEMFRPVRAAIDDLQRHPETVFAALEVGAEKAGLLAEVTLARAREAMGLLAR